jgi:small subunit ribosomal protein S8
MSTGRRARVSRGRRAAARPRRSTDDDHLGASAPTDHAVGPCRNQGKTERKPRGTTGNHGEEGHQAMTMTDPIADMLTRLRNANAAYHDSVGMPYSRIKVHIAEILQQEGYIAGWRVEDADVGKNLVVALKFGPSRERSIAGLKRVSKPGLRVYAKKDGLPRVLGGLGIAIISTSTGLMTDRQAKKRGVGGEVLAFVW